MRRGNLTARLLAATLALACALAPSASRAAGVPPSEPPPVKCSETPTGQWPEPEGLYRSGACLIQGVGGLSISPQVVTVGEAITATVPGTNPRPEWSWGWKGFVAEVGGGQVLSGCGEDSTSCTVKASAEAASSTWEVFSHAVSYPGIFGGTSYSSEYFIIEGGGGTITGSVSSPSHKGLAGVTVAITGTSASGQAVSDTATTAADGVYSQSVPEGSYSVAPTGTPPGQPAGGEYKVLACPGSEGRGSCSLRVSAGASEASFEYSPPHNQVSIALEPLSVSADGFGVVSATITVSAPNGEPVAGRAISVEPPVTYEQPAIICDEGGRLAYPGRLSDGSILGAHFVRTTNAAGQIHLTIFTGTVAGSWLLEAGEEEAPRSQWAHAQVGVSEATGGRSELPPELTAILHSESQSNETLVNFRRSGLADVLEFLGQEKASGALGGVGFMPVFSRDPAGILNVGVALFAEAFSVREALFNYLDEKTSTPLPESQAVVIDIAGMQALHFTTFLAEHPTTVIGDHLYSLAQWENGSLVAIGENLRGEHPHIPIPARGRPHAGFPPPLGNESLLYEYGPYPPFGAEGAVRSAFVACIGGNAGGLSASGGTGGGGLDITAHSPVSLLAVGAHGQRAGIGARGGPLDTIPGAIVRHHGREVSELKLPAGAYRLILTGTGRGHATLVVSSSSVHGLQSEVFSFRVRRGERGRLALRSGKSPTTMRLGRRRLRGARGVPLSVHGLPSALPHGVRSTLTLSVADQFGRPAAGVTVSVSGGSGAPRLQTVSTPTGRVAITLDPPAPGRLTVTLAAPGYRPKTVNVKVT
ncbi:MAG TPA: carboxypeptidase-like regulatory domain-containing protein [Solirubrobacteraceae bacterium]|nr:carboxypeptidase-like regulatory domain-containing protein [Solirubrobacteraceae bacterium]